MAAPKFFKIILDAEAHIVRIPPLFMRRYGQNLGKKVILQAHNGPLFKVDLLKSDGETYLDEGWQEFQDLYSIDVEYLLVFEYHGNSQFQVMIYDPTATEIDYPSTDDDNESEGIGKAKIVQDSTDDDDSVGFSNTKLQPGRGVAKETSIAYQKALAFSRALAPTNSFFISLMQPTYVTKGYAMNVPFNFAKENMSSQRTDLTIRVENGKAWSMLCCVHAARAAKLCIGWKKFVEENGLKVGDACIFQVAKGANFVWDAFIFRC